MPPPRGPVKERSHLSTGNSLPRAVTQRTGSTPRGDASRRQSVDVVSMGVAINVDKPRRLGNGCESERSGKERSHLSTGNSLSRAVTQRTRLTTRSNTEDSETLHKRSPPHTGIHIRETRRTCRGRILTVENPNQPNRHHPTLQRLPRTEPPRRTPSALEHTVSRQRIDSIEMNPSLRRVREPARRNHSRRPPIRVSPHGGGSRRERTSQRREYDPNHKNAKTHAAAHPTASPQQNSDHDQVDTQPEG